MQSIIDFIMAHSVVIAAAVVGILDLIFALVPSLESNGILHALYLWLKGLMVKK